jgi:hypothetical protein
MELRDQLQATAALTPDKELQLACSGVWMGTTAGLDGEENFLLLLEGK